MTIEDIPRYVQVGRVALARKLGVSINDIEIERLPDWVYTHGGNTYPVPELVSLMSFKDIKNEEVCSCDQSIGRGELCSYPPQCPSCRKMPQRFAREHGWSE